MRNLRKSILAVLLIFCLVMPTAFAADTDAVEIKFSVGDSVLLINGTPTEVETPYVVGAGVTLVPVRVITEAFGATVGWEADTKTITISYPDVEIVIQIGNTTAEVNKKTEQLLSAPELTPAGFTMVPLRFISETFGATVSYDNETGAITVIKQKEDASQTVTEIITEAKIGDSYYNWSMENPDDVISMSHRTFDGTETEFEYDENNGFGVYVIPIDTDYDFEKDFYEQKDSLKDYTLVKADKDASNPDAKMMHFQAKNKDVFINAIYYVTPEYIYDIIGYFETGFADRDECIRIMSTFALGFDDSDTYDLSIVKDGVRQFKAEAVNFEISIPENYALWSDEEIENEFIFRKYTNEDSISSIHIGIFSKESEDSAEALANKDHTHNKQMLNENLAEFTDVEEKKYNGIKVYEYTQKITGTKESNEYMRDVFFEKGAYIYNISVTVKTPDENAEKFATDILNSMKAGEIDQSEVGILIRNTYDDNEVYTSKTSDWSIKLPNTYEDVEVKTDSAAYLDKLTGTIFTYQNIGVAEIGRESVEDIIMDAQRAIRTNSKNKIIETADRYVFGVNTFWAYIYKTEIEGEIVYVKEYATKVSEKLHVFTFIVPELSYSRYNMKKIDDIVASFMG